MNSSGRTPLFRAKKLEALLGISEIYLKLEGSNPYHHKYDRIAELLIKDAQAAGKSVILVDGPRVYINSVRRFAEAAGLETRIPWFKGQAWKLSFFGQGPLLDLRAIQTADSALKIEELCDGQDYYNGATGYHNRHLSILALETIGDELTGRLDDISSVFVQLSYGYTLSSLYNSFLRSWSRGQLQRYPKIYSCTIPKGNRIYEDYKRRNAIPDLEEYHLRVNKYTKDLYIENTQLLEEALKAVRDTEGEIVTITEGQLEEAAGLLRSTEFIHLSTEEAYSFAGFYKEAKAGRIGQGRHVIILNNGRSDVQVERYQPEGSLSKAELISLVDTFLVQYSDPLNEIEDAVNNALEKGAIFLASINGEIQGLTIVVHGGFSDFFPTYHLAYIGTRAGRKGRGIASELIDAVIDFTAGKVSLHVDLDNGRARKLYEKFGFKSKYYRMIYQSDTLKT